MIVDLYMEVNDISPENKNKNKNSTSKRKKKCSIRKRKSRLIVSRPLHVAMIMKENCAKHK
jgi:hypothetical protein